MIRLNGSALTKDDKAFLRMAIRFTMNGLMPDGAWKNANINVWIKDLKKVRGHEDQDRGSCEVDTRKTDKMTCTIVLHDGLIKMTSGLRIWSRHYNLLYYLFHELVHVKQYLTGEMKDLGQGKYKFKNRVFKMPDEKDLEAYYNQPMEIEAYGRQDGLVVLFYKHWKEFAKNVAGE